MPFQITKFPKVKAQIQALMKRLTELGIRHICFDALERIQDHLENRPLEWGDPDFNLNVTGAVAFHGIEDPLVVRYSVFEAENVVILFDIRPLPASPLAGP